MMICNGGDVFCGKLLSWPLPAAAEENYAGLPHSLVACVQASAVLQQPDRDGRSGNIPAPLHVRDVRRT